jgi:hypothetical protein
MYKNGVYEPSGTTLHEPADPYHSVKILGWGNENGVPYWVSFFLFFFKF